MEIDGDEQFIIDLFSESGDLIVSLEVEREEWESLEETAEAKGIAIEDVVRGALVRMIEDERHEEQLREEQLRLDGLDGQR